MDAGLLKTLGEVSGIGGLALGIFFLLFREVIQKSIFPTLKRDDGYKLLQLISILIWSVAVVGIGAWLWGDRKSADSLATTSGPQSPIFQQTNGNVAIDFNARTDAPQ
jgi:hypothetical protein